MENLICGHMAPHKASGFIGAYFYALASPFAPLPVGPCFSLLDFNSSAGANDNALSATNTLFLVKKHFGLQ
jgi:hypothetical protein